jgi:hypothetical protein
MVTEAEIQAVKGRHEASLLQKANVVGLGIGYKEKEGQKTDQLSLVVLVNRKASLCHLRPEDAIPSEIEGVPTDVREVGEIRAL